MSKRNKGARARARKARLLTMRAELAILLENQLDPRHLQLNTHSTIELLEHVREFGTVPLKFGAYTRYNAWRDDLNGLPEDLKGLPELVFNDKVGDYERAMDVAMLTGTGIVRLTPDQQSGKIMDMDSGNASGHDT